MVQLICRIKLFYTYCIVILPNLVYTLVFNHSTCRHVDSDCILNFESCQYLGTMYMKHFIQNAAITSFHLSTVAVHH